MYHATVTKIFSIFGVTMYLLNVFSPEISLFSNYDSKHLTDVNYGWVSWFPGLLPSHRLLIK